MPRPTYSRRTRRRTRRRTPWYNRRYNAMQLAAKAAKGVWYLKGLVNSEMLHNQSTGNTVVPSTGVVTLLNGMGQGDAASARTGNSILMRNVFLRLCFTQNAAAVTTIYRVMLVLDKQQVGDTLPTISDILETVNPLSPLATASVGRFKVMKNWFFTTDDTKSQTRTIDYYKDFRFHTRYNGASNTDIQKNGLYLILLSDQPVNTPRIDYTWKVGYHDN